jgi:Holliday junction resolvasome RuvABC endonuclease subunit
MSIIKVASVDPSLANFGMAVLRLDLFSMKFAVEHLELIHTEKRANKTVRQNSDDLRRAQEIIDRFHACTSDAAICFAEIPTGAQSARAAFAFGLAVGVIAGCPVPVVQVQPHETKLATVGTKTASKAEMIEWAVEQFPEAPWKRVRGRITNDNEHLADAVAIAHAGIKTDQFWQLSNMWKLTRERQETAAKVRDAASQIPLKI